uniref:Uncharacterized protein n=1 Tax=Caenorhabditis japonica TaxID=281687 RepID=A0A8R1EW35_CAEJA
MLEGIQVGRLAWPGHNVHSTLCEPVLDKVERVFRIVVLLEQPPTTYLKSSRWQHFLLHDVLVHVALDGSGDSDERAYASCVEATSHHDAATTVLNGRNLVLGIVPFVNWTSYKSDSLYQSSNTLTRRSIVPYSTPVPMILCLLQSS